MLGDEFLDALNLVRARKDVGVDAEKEHLALREIASLLIALRSRGQVADIRRWRRAARLDRHGTLDQVLRAGFFDRLRLFGFRFEIRDVFGRLTPDLAGVLALLHDVRQLMRQQALPGR